jgi:hypothetical protein
VNRVTMGGLACGLTILLLTSCSSGLDTDGPFGGSGPNSGGICAHARPGGVAYDGFQQFPNRGDTAIIYKIRLAHSRHLRLVAAWVLLTPDRSVGIGVGGGYPTASSGGPGNPGRHLWSLRQRIPGAVVPHTHGKEIINLVVVAKPTAKVGTSNAIDLYYKSAGKHYLLHIPYGFSVKVARTC